MNSYHSFQLEELKSGTAPKVTHYMQCFYLLHKGSSAVKKD